LLQEPEWDQTGIGVHVFGAIKSCSFAVLIDIAEHVTCCTGQQALGSRVIEVQVDKSQETAQQLSDMGRLKQAAYHISPYHAY